MKVLVTQSCLCDPMDFSRPGSSVHGVLQARILERVAISFSRGSSQPKIKSPILQADFLPSEPPGNLCHCSLVQSHLTLWPQGLQHARFLCLSLSTSLFKLMSIELVISSNHLIVCCLLLLPSIFPSSSVFSREPALHIRWPKYWSFSFSNSPFNEYVGLISYRIDWCIY